jgi:hypothetical protein
MIELFLEAMQYVYNQPYFWGSMAFTTIIGMCIGAIIYDGLLNEVKKACLTVSAYSIIVIAVTLTRTFPQINLAKAMGMGYQVFANMATVFIVTIFYILGMLLSVKLISRLYKK